MIRECVDLRPGRKYDIATTGVSQTTPLNLRTTSTNTMQTEVVGPASSDASKSMSVRVVSPIDGLPIEAPPDFRN